MSVHLAMAVVVALLAAVIGWRVRRHIRRLADQVRILEALVDGTPHPIYIRDQNGRLLSCNDSYLKTFGCERQAVLGRNVTDGVLAGSPDAEAYEQGYRQVIASGKPLVCDRSLTFAGTTLTLYHWTLPYRDTCGEVRGVVCGWVDVSERYRLLQELQRAKEQADAASAAKSHFLATLSHEIRTPVNALQGLLEVALARARAGQADEASLAVAHRAGQGLLGLVGDVLDLSRIEAGKLQVVAEATDLARLVDDSAALFIAAAEEKGLALQVKVSAAARRCVLVDTLRLRQVLSNLVSNAIKYTPAGQVTIALHGRPTGDGASLAVHLCVQDTGIGIEQADQAEAFTPYTQFNSPGTGRPGSGAGLGLAICRELCGLLGAGLHLQSTPGTGTVVCLSLQLPLATPLDAAPVPAAPAFFAQAEVLVADDHPANRMVLSRQLHSLGLRPSSVEDGTQALEQWQAQHHAVVIADCNMPGLDGYGLARAIRALEAGSAAPPCVILGYTANARPEEHEYCRAAGMNGCLFKPLQLEGLRQALAQHLPAAPAAPTEPRLREAVGDSCRTDRERLAEATCDTQRLVLAHRIKGMARIVGAHALEAAACELEAACRLSGDARAASQSLEHALLAMERACQ